MPRKKKEEKEKKERKGEEEGKKEEKKEVAKIAKTKIQKTEKFPTMRLEKEHEIAMDFATKVYEKFTKTIKSIILFGSTAKRLATSTSDIDIIIILDDCTIQWDAELIAWYREELGKLIAANPYKKALHVNSVRLTTWWNDMLRGDPVVINVIRWGEPLIDFGGFFTPLKFLLQEGKLRSTPEAIYTALQRAPAHMARSKAAVLSSIEGLYWAVVDSAHAALIAAKELPPSPEEIPSLLTEHFVKKKMLHPKYVAWYSDLFRLAHKILRGEITTINGKEVDMWTARADEFVRIMAQLIKKIT